MALSMLQNHRRIYLFGRLRSQSIEGGRGMLAGLQEVLVKARAEKQAIAAFNVNASFYKPCYQY
jgi:hypothetical protein